PEGSGWLRTFGGGLLATCGLDTFGVPAEDAGERLGQHGRIGAQRAQITRTEVTDDELIVEGVVRQTRVFGEHLVLRRRITSRIGSDGFRIEDTVTNESYRDQPHMILYHMNLGWPLLGERTRIEIPATRVVPRDPDAEAGFEDREVFGPPTPGFAEQVFTHALPERESRIAVTNPDNGLSFELTIDADQLPWVFQWKMAGQSHYALGIEPANTPNLFGRAAARAAGELPILRPGERTAYALEVRLRRDAVGTDGSASIGVRSKEAS
ncbi:aldose 1-epimerase family protein, partial [Leucobacter soli]